MDELVSEYDPVNGMFHADYEQSAKAFKALEIIGELEKVLAVNSSSIRVDIVMNSIAESINTDTFGMNPNDPLGKILALYRISQIVNNSLTAYHTEFTPVSDNGYTIKSWQPHVVNDYTLVRIETPPVESNRTSDVICFILFGSITQ